MIAFEEKVRQGGAVAVEELFHFFPKNGHLFDAFRSVARHLSEMKVPYAMMGGAALAVHGAFCGTQEIIVLIGAN